MQPLQMHCLLRADSGTASSKACGTAALMHQQFEAERPQLIAQSFGPPQSGQTLGSSEVLLVMDSCLAARASCSAGSWYRPQWQRVGF